MRPPTFSHERALTDAGHRIIGIDEAGCGCLAGPVVAAAIHLPMDSRLGLIRDSKLLSRQQRERLFAVFRARGYRWAIGIASWKEVDAVNIRNATYLAMRRAVEGFLQQHSSSRAESQRSREIPDRSEISPLGAASVETTSDRNLFALVDAWTIPGITIAQRGIIHGDQLVKSIAAASIIAKVTRDAIMEKLDREHPRYGFAAHKGYATAYHRAAIRRHGLSPVHRRSFCTKYSVAATSLTGG
ncbi:MAG: ribonuclease HII [bacterium]|nr:ribonuclease HII [bacterium]